MNKFLKGAVAISAVLLMGGCVTKTHQSADFSKAESGCAGQGCAQAQPGVVMPVGQQVQPVVAAAPTMPQPIIVPEEPKQPLPPPDLVFLVNGEGISPQNTISPAQALALAKRAAVADAYRQLTEKLYGVKVNARETVKDAVLQNSNIMLRVDGLIRNAQILDSEFKNGMYVVTMELRISRERWRTIFF